MNNETITPQTETKFLEASITKASDGSFIAVASTNSVDRHGEIVDNNGWDLKAYKKNPVILWGHDHNEPAIGISKKTWVEGTGKQAKLMITPLLHDVTETARAVKALVEMGVTKTLSVGFKPMESPDGITFTKNELLEVSIVNVPANSDAMMLAYKGLKEAGFKDKTIKAVGVELDNQAVIDKKAEMSKDIEELKSMVKAQPVNPEATKQRLSMLKVIARASDKILEADNKAVAVDKTELVKTIKKVTEIMTVTEKNKL